MKRALFITALVLAVFLVAGCSTWEETTLTVVNNAGEDIEIIRVDNGDISRGAIDINILTAPLAHGESIEIPLAPVLHQNGYATISIETGLSVRTLRIAEDPEPDPDPTRLTFESPFTYEEGAKVVITFNGDIDEDPDGDADIEHGDWVTLE